MKRENSKHDEKGQVLKWKLAGGSGGMLQREILKLKSSKIAGNVYFASYSASSKLSRRVAKVHEKGHFAKVFEKLGARAPCAPGSYVHGCMI